MTQPSDGEVSEQMRHILEVENKQPLRGVDFVQVEKLLRKLRSVGKHSFAVLSTEDGSFVQISGGRVTCIVELKWASQASQLRATLVKPRVRGKR